MDKSQHRIQAQTNKRGTASGRGAGLWSSCQVFLAPLFSLLLFLSFLVSCDAVDEDD